MRLCKFSHVLWFLIFFQVFANSFGFFFPMFGNFFNRFRNNHNNGGNHFGARNGGGLENGGGVSIFSKAASASTATGNVTSLTVPMLRSASQISQRRVDIVTTVISPVDDSNSTSSNSSSTSEQKIEVHSNITTRASDSSLSPSDQHVFSQKLIVPTSTSVTSSISASHQGIPLHLNDPHFKAAGNSLTLPFTPNLFGMMSYVQALKDIKRNYKDQEKERKIAFMFQKKDDDLMTRILRTLIHKVVNKYQKQTEILKLKILKRQDKLQNFLQLPMVSQVIALDQARAVGGGLPLRNIGAGVLVPQASTTTSHVVQVSSKSGKPVQSIMSSFLI